MSRKKKNMPPTLNQKISAHYSAIWCIFIVIENLTVHERLPMNKRTNLEKMPISVIWVVQFLSMIEYLQLCCLIQIFHKLEYLVHFLLSKMCPLQDLLF